MRLAAITAVVAVGIAALPPGLALAAMPQEDLREARQKFRAGEYDDVIQLLAPLLYPTKRLADPRDSVDAHIMLGVSYYKRDDKPAAERELREALELEARMLGTETALDPLLYSEDVIRFFDAIKAEMKAELEKERKTLELEREKERLQQLLRNSRTIVVENRAYWVNFVPLGAGQFQNRQRGKGYLFFVSEAVLGGASLTAFSLFATRYGMFPHRIPAKDVDAARKLQVVFIGTGALFWVVAGVGIIDALANYQPKVTITRKVDPRDLELLDEPLPSPPSSFHIAPTVFPDGAGVTLGWEF